MIATPGYTPEPSSSTFKILLVDDAAADGEVLPSFADGVKQFEVIEFLLGESLFTYLQQVDQSSYPNVIILDRVSGTLSAFDILQNLKNDPKYSVIVILVWIYYSAVILYLGAEFTQVATDAMGGHIEPAEYAVHVQQHEVEKKVDTLPIQHHDVKN